MKKVKRGDSLSIEARDWNRLADLANRFGAQSTPGAAQLGPELVRVKNTLGRDLSRYAAVCIGSPTTTELHTGKNDQVFGLVNGSVQGRYGGFYAGGEIIIGVLQEPIANGRIGMVQISGVTPAQFRVGELPSVGVVGPADFATISDLDDMLVPAQFGAVRVLQRNISVSGSWTSDEYWWVLLGTAGPSLGSLRLRGAYDGTPANTVWNELYGDRRALGFYSENGEIGPYPAADQLKLCRPGRYDVSVRYTASSLNPSGGYATGDRAEWQIIWADGGSWYQNSDEYGTATPSAWSESVIYSGERTFNLLVENPSTPVTIPLPTVRARRIAFSNGAATALTMSGGGKLEIEVVCLGAKSYYTYWSKALKDAAFARGASAGPT